MPFLLPGLFLVGYTLKKVMSWKKVIIISLLFLSPFSLFYLFLSLAFSAISNTHLSDLDLRGLIQVIFFVFWPLIFYFFGALVSDFFNKQNER